MPVRRTLQRLGRSEGQVLPIAALVFGMVLLGGFVVIDVGLLYNDRRDAQNDVDLAALAGALQIATDDPAHADDIANDWLTNNGVDLADPEQHAVVAVVRDCFSANDGQDTGVRVTLTRKPASFFLGVFGIAGWQTTSTATACFGRTVAQGGFLPFALSQASPCFQALQPRPGYRCDVQIDNSPSVSGQLGLSESGDCDDGNPSSSVLSNNIEHGSQVSCAIGGSVQGGPGFSVGPTKSGLAARLASEGACDHNYPGTQAVLDAAGGALNAATNIALHAQHKNDGIDDFYEVWEYDATQPHPAMNLSSRACGGASGTSPRNVTAIVIADAQHPDGAAGPHSYIVRGFVRAYLEGCTKGGTFYPRCDFNGGGGFTVHVRFVEQIGATGGTLGVAGYGDGDTFLAR